jgi:hypothetical protein
LSRLCRKNFTYETICRYSYRRLFQNFSFGTATLDLREKTGFRPLFPGACGKTRGFWNRLIEQQKLPERGFYGGSFA